MTPLTLHKNMTETTFFKYSPIPIAARILSISCRITVPLWYSRSFVSTSAFSVALTFALASQFTSNYNSQQLSQDWYFKGNPRKKMNAIEFKISLNISFYTPLNIIILDQFLGWLPSMSLEEVTKGNMRLNPVKDLFWIPYITYCFCGI